MRNYFVIGTDTDVGKTYFCALLVKGLGIGYYKAAQSGKDANGETDEDYVRRVGETENTTVSYSFEKAYSPHLAARFDDRNEPVTMERIMADYAKVLDTAGHAVWEGAGGVICPLRCDDNEEIYLMDLIRAFKEKDAEGVVLLVSKAGLGAINSCVLTCDYLKARGISVDGIVMNGFEEGNIIHEDNRHMIEVLTGVKVIETVKNGQKELAFQNWA